jgi:hypothetical protein
MKGRYLRRRSCWTGAVLKGMFSPQLARHLVEQALESGVLHATADALERSPSAHRDELDDATIVLLDGVEVSRTDLGSLGASA